MCNAPHEYDPDHWFWAHDDQEHYHCSEFADWASGRLSAYKPRDGGLSSQDFSKTWTCAEKSEAVHHYVNLFAQFECCRYRNSACANVPPIASASRGGAVGVLVASHTFGPQVLTSF
jgi:hypothetical protein